MKIYFDTDIIIDVLKRREPFYENSNMIFMLAVDGIIDGIVCTSAVADIYYLSRKQYDDTRTTTNIIFDILEIIKPVDTLVNDIFSAAELDFQEFEDAVIASIAQREKADYIITRDTKDFTNSPVQAITPDKFLANIKL